MGCTLTMSMSPGLVQMRKTSIWFLGKRVHTKEESRRLPRKPIHKWWRWRNLSLNALTQFSKSNIVWDGVDPEDILTAQEQQSIEDQLTLRHLRIAFMGLWGLIECPLLSFLSFLSFYFCSSDTHMYATNGMYGYFITLFLVVKWNDRVTAKFDFDSMKIGGN